MSGAESSSDFYFRFSRRSLFAVLFLLLVLGAGGVTIALNPGGAVSRAVAKASYLFPIMVVMISFALQGPLRQRGLTAKSPEAKMVLEDEWRRKNMDRALRAAFVVVLIVQVPPAVSLAGHDAFHALMAMAIATIASGMVSFTALFLYFDREGRDEQ